MGYSIEETVKLNQLFDIYQELLTAKQKEYFGYYFSEDYSLSEIADLLGVSRNAVHLQIKNIIKHLYSLEQKLKILEKNHNLDELFDSLKDESLSSNTKNIIQKIEKVK
ncbi:MAG: sigma factor-like helix-turn-helix DNA-binding protein [Candidatus Izemoplasmatales bacterium]|nr:sigma factor-like helix-turn-helix DNA-binding protein [Candidatus Izemoplasmatales bacterium]